MAKRIKDTDFPAFAEALWSFLLDPDGTPPPFEIEPVVEAGLMGLHIFWPVIGRQPGYATAERFIKFWNAHYPDHLMVKHMEWPDYCFSETAEPIDLEQFPSGQGMSKGRLYMHLTLDNIFFNYGVDYPRSQLFANIMVGIQAGIYRNNYTIETLLYRRGLEDYNGPPVVSDTEISDFLLLDENFGRVVLGANCTSILGAASGTVVPVVENGQCGIHLRHPDILALDLFRANSELMLECYWGSTIPGCSSPDDVPYLHIGFARHGKYLPETRLFNQLPGRRR